MRAEERRQRVRESEMGDGARRSEGGGFEKGFQKQRKNDGCKFEKLSQKKEIQTHRLAASPSLGPRLKSVMAAISRRGRGERVGEEEELEEERELKREREI